MKPPLGLKAKSRSPFKLCYRGSRNLFVLLLGKGEKWLTEATWDESIKMELTPNQVSLLSLIEVSTKPHVVVLVMCWVLKKTLIAL